MSKLTNHAHARIHERCSLTPQEVCSKLKRNECFPFGEDGNHNHMLINSEYDNELFVVVQDRFNYDIITVMPLKWHHKWELSPELIEMAKKHFEPKQKCNEDESKSKLEKIKNHCTKNVKQNHKVVITTNIKATKSRMIDYSGEEVLSSRSFGVKLCELDKKYLIQMGYCNEALTLEILNKEILINTKFHNNIKSLIKDCTHKIFESPESGTLGKIFRYGKKELKYLELSFAIAVDSSASPITSFGTIKVNPKSFFKVINEE